MLDEFFQLLLEGPIVDDLLSLAVMIGAIFFCSGKCGTIPDWSRAPKPQLILDIVEDLANRESQWCEILFLQFVGLERIW